MTETTTRPRRRKAAPKASASGAALLAEVLQACRIELTVAERATCTSMDQVAATLAIRRLARSQVAALVIEAKAEGTPLVLSDLQASVLAECLHIEEGALASARFVASLDRRGASETIAHGQRLSRQAILVQALQEALQAHS